MSSISGSERFLKISSALLQPGVPFSVQSVLTQLVWHRNKRTGQCNPRIGTLATELHLSRRTVCHALAWLKQSGILAGRDSGCRNDSYTILPEREWPARIGERLKRQFKNVTLQRCTPVHSRGAPGCTPEVHLVHSIASVSIYESEKRTREKELRESAAFLERARVVTTKKPPAHEKGETPDTPDANLSRLANALTDGLMEDHPRPGRPREARLAMTALLGAVDGEDRVQLAVRISEAHAAWRDFWDLGILKRRRYIPMFAEWLTSGDWESPPSDTQFMVAGGLR